MKEFRKVHQFNCFSCNSPVQFALAEFLKNESAYLDLGNFLQRKRDYFRKLMQQTVFKVIPSHGSYFECYLWLSACPAARKTGLKFLSPIIIT
jgi:methionine aminotransferase